MPGQQTSDSPEVSVVMPCLNEAETLAVCIQKARACLADNGVSGEIIIADNGSTDGSQSIAEAEGARVVPVEARGYGSALMGGIAACARAIRHHGRCRRQLRLFRAHAVHRKVARR